MTNFIKVISIVLILALAVLTQQVISNSWANQVLKADYAEINHIKYGLFSVDEWKKQLEVIVADEISDFDLSRSNEKQLRAQVQAQLGILIDKVDERIHKSNEGSFKGRLKQAFINAVVNMKDIKAGIPQYTDAMMAELKKAKTERKLKTVVKTEVAKVFSKTYDITDRTYLYSVLARAGTLDIPQAKVIIADRIGEREHLILQQSWLMIGLAVFLFVLIGFKREKLSPTEYFVLLGSLIMMLAAGVATPMIDMEAKISSMSFVLLDHEIGFKNQILYFQSKSILDVFWLMINHPDLPMKMVGLLVVTFSIVFPITKLASSCLYYFDYLGARKNRFAEFFVLKSGKWSMSDVLVVAIFMAYVGFNGIISSQIGKLSQFGGDIDLLTTNGTTLQPGFFLFLTYVLLGMTLSVMISRKEKASDKTLRPGVRSRFGFRAIFSAPASVSQRELTAIPRL